MTEAVKLVSEFAFREFGLSRITANVFHFNAGSARVLEKAGFQCEGYLRQHYKKDGKIFDGKLYAKISSDQAIKATAKNSPILQTNRLILRAVKEDDIPAILRYYRENELRFAPTDPPKPEGFYTEEFWRERLGKARKAWDAEQALGLSIFEKCKDDLVGTINFSQMFRGPFHACYLGYGIGGKFEGKGLMTEALEAAIQYIFNELNFHRIMANHLPENERSANLLKRLGFTVEGVAKDYLFIDGKWRDHVLNSLTNPKWRQNA